MKKLMITAGGMLFAFFSATAQLPNTDWQETPVKHSVASQYEKESAVMLEDQRIYEYKRDEKDEMSIYTYNRCVVKVNDDKGVEMFNKIYIYVPASGEVKEIKARVLLPNGKVMNLDPSKILDEDEEGRHYKKFALEGVEKGSEIEYISKLKKEISTFGTEIFQLQNTPIVKASFTLITPKHLLFSVKGYNGFDVSKDSLVNEKRVINAWKNNISVLKDEKYGVTEPYRSNVQYKLSYNLDKDKSVRLYTWNELAKNVYNNYNSFSESEQKAINSFYKQIKLDEQASEEAKIIAIEDYIKTNISTEEQSIGDDAEKIERIIKTKNASNFGFNRLFNGLLEKAGINHQIVFPSKRDDLPLDEDFENFRLVDDMLFYFPGTGEFLQPVNAGLRYPYVSPYLAATKGLFLKGTTIGSFSTALANFDTIPIQSYEKSAHNMEVQLKFNEQMDSLLIHCKQILLGYGAVFYRPAYSFLSKDKQDDFTKDVIKSVANSDRISNVKVENSALTDGSKGLPLNIIADISSAELIENASNKILFKIGEVIGPQEQMYEDKERKLPIILQYPHALDRDISFTIPAGYRIKNPADLNFNVTDKNQSIGFVSSYTIDGSVLNVKIHEYYKITSYPISQIEEYRKIINASADFNKVVLVLEKTN